MVPTGGSGQMLSMPINEFIQQGWTDIGLQVEFQPVELEVAYTAWRKGAADPSLKGITASNIAYVTSDPFYALHPLLQQQADRARRGELERIQEPGGGRVVRPGERQLRPGGAGSDSARRIHEKVVDDAVQVWVVHDTNPHALSARVQSYTQAQHWFQDLTTLS